jgi:hypothetical protein
MNRKNEMNNKNKIRKKHLTNSQKGIIIYEN